MLASGVCKAAESGVPAPRGVDGFIRLSRRLAQRLAAGKFYPGPARLFRRPLPISFLLMAGIITALYLLAAEMTKRFFYKKNII